MTTLAPTLEAYFTDRLLCQQRVSPNTVASYRDAFRLLLAFVQKKTGTPPSRLGIWLAAGVRGAGLTVASDNPGARRVYERLGMTVLSTLEEYERPI